jgi:pseudaminic acid synthase
MNSITITGNLGKDAELRKPIFDRCKKHGVLAFSTPFDETAVDFLESLNAPFYKIASFELTDLPLIKKVASTGKPMIMSTGMANVSEIDDAVKAARGAGCRDLILLKCTSTYPASPESTNILTIPHMMQLFQCHVGLSDHTMGIGAAVASVALGAVLIEKHFTNLRSDGGVDSAFSLEPSEMKSLVVESERAWLSLGDVRYGPTEREKSSLQFRRSLYVVADVKAGQLITRENVRAIRPGFGLSPKFFEEVVGKRATQDLTMGTPLSWGHIEFSN